jgi:hypothetical protein
MQLLGQHTSHRAAAKHYRYLRICVSTETGSILRKRWPNNDDFLLCLERTVGERNGADAALWASGSFNAQVYPDLPFAATWADLVRKGIFHRDQQQSGQGSQQHAFTSQGFSATADAWTVRTVAAQCRSLPALRSLMQSACSTEDSANALLLLSGSHPARQLPFLAPWLQDSFSLLREASRMRDHGELPSNLGLWAVENPVNPPERLWRKAECGAEVVLTQPPFLRDRGEAWFTAAAAVAAQYKTRVIAGVPMITSMNNLVFWLALCGLSGSAHGVLESFPKSGIDKEEYKRAVWKWNADFVRWVSVDFFYR